MCDQGGSTRDRPLRDERRVIFHPNDATSETLVKAITKWENNLHQYVLQRPRDVFSPEDKIMCLEDMCPELIQKFLAEQHLLGIISSYEDYKDAIDRYYYQEKRWNKKRGGINLTEWHSCTEGCADQDHSGQWSEQY